ncbi:30S ribosomal protein S12 methylthiotransferase RimO [Taibaiella sp. KBW10]|uniref:30S ribosomal protein S12 methylthiotransferase RimO n=1 Tax=Taibaiella sp. KBW10 TaxID=2153357 RepID=UPI000F59F7B1|nr:30S ribosomal protein S12 methylthiotransferase RimO [Taibaiella sp. KBW10]RQO30638.1 30S ribosomal protein S12 methylthiotransferase RimO [Taibaiella sp. KBW10]
MKSKTLKQNKVNIITLGCSKNLVDSEVLSGQLKANDINVIHENEKMDHNIVVVNTCGFIDKAKEESVNTILEQVALKEEGKLDKVLVTGCLSERYRQDLAKEIPEVDAWFGTLELPFILKELEADFKKELLGERLLSTPKHYAYLKISEGCNRTCSFCAIPLMRGTHISKPIEEIITEAKHLVKNGVKEVMLIAQELTYYGLDLYKKRALSELLEQLAQVEGLKWIRLHYAYPTKFPLEILEVVKKYDNICNYLDIPLQHCSDKMLKAMKRQITKKEMVELIHNIREAVPGIAIRTTMITGFPGETLEDVEEMKAFLEEMQFERVGIFTYSHEENTTAYELEDTLSSEEKERRAQEIMEVQQEISYTKNQDFIGKELNVLIDKIEAGRYIARTEFDSVEVDNEVIINTDEDLPIGDFVKVRITKAYDYDLEAELI